jgi:hypothetical protein
MWNSTYNELLRALSCTGLVTMLACSIGLYGCHRCLQHFNVVKLSKMKESPGQEYLLLFFYFNFVLFSIYTLFGTFCIFYQQDATAWLEAKYLDKHSWDSDFKGLKLRNVSNHVQMILTLAGIAAYLVAFLNFSCLYISLKISMAFETIHTII